MAIRFICLSLSGKEKQLRKVIHDILKINVGQSGAGMVPVHISSTASVIAETVDKCVAAP